MKLYHILSAGTGDPVEIGICGPSLKWLQFFQKQNISRASN